MRRLLIAATLALAPLTACTTIPAGPGEVANQTVLDERGAIGANLAYVAASKGAALAIRTRAITDPATIRRIGDLDRQGVALARAATEAYRAGNAASYQAAVDRALAAVALLNDAF